MPEYLVRLVQVHESFRKAELEALAELAGIEMEFISYSEDSPFCIISLPSSDAAARLITRSILSQGIYELWGHGPTYAALHTSLRGLSPEKWSPHRTSSFRFTLDSFQGSLSPAAQRAIIESFSYLPLDGPIRMKSPTLDLCVFEAYELHAASPRSVYLGALVAGSGRAAKTTFDLKKRHYISTTSMDAELALVTANLALAAPGRLFYDPFMGTGGFPVAAAHFGAVGLGSDIDGRSIRGKGGRDVRGNFRQYGLEGLYLDGFISDLTNSPVRGCMGENGGERERGAWLDGIVCDPPYGVREGLKVLGLKEGRGEGRKDLTPNIREPGYIPPKRPYSFTALLDDILHFASLTLVENGRLAMWMPTANDEDIELAIPTHPCLKVVSVCVQPFNKWSRRLLTYRRLPDSEVDRSQLIPKREHGAGIHADELNDFRRK
ncbi:tRNA guanosine-2'-O-methyltransferase TRM11 [Glonium stellatum]|uniref:tRNA (guanine(10)-N(2))-methyltransferase n=1 Tax=Glonium stellatum TaxID=574774 RepID=A0A8E2JL78_9PEZI|nr:tRNA guanosine-2'-O-methyltransferase TRM11 [Glonium stellatum]